MSLFAKIDRTTMAIIARKQFDNPELADDVNKPKWVPVTEGAKPSVNTDVAKLERTETVSLNGVHISWNVVPLSAEELKQRELDGLSSEVAELAFIVLKGFGALVDKGTLLINDFGQETGGAFLRLRGLVDAQRANPGPPE